MKKISAIFGIIFIVMIALVSMISNKLEIATIATETTSPTKPVTIKDLKSKFDADAKIINYEGLPNYGYIDLYNAIDPYFEQYDISVNASTEKHTISYYDEDEIDFEEYDEDEYEKEERERKRAAKKYYKDFKNNQIRIDDFVVTKFKDGWCVNKYIFDKKKFKAKKDDITNITIEIPRELDGKKVLKLGCYLDIDEDSYADEYFIYKGFLCTIPEKYNITIKIPDTVTDISCGALDDYSEFIPDDYEGHYDTTGYVTGIEVDENNLYYKSDDGVLLSKDGEWLLYLRPKYSDYDNRWQYTVPDTVKYIADTHISDYIDSYYDLTIGRNVEKIYSDIWFGDCGSYHCNFNVYRNSYAQRWLEAKEITDYNLI